MDSSAYRTSVPDTGRPTTDDRRPEGWHGAVVRRPSSVVEGPASADPPADLHVLVSAYTCAPGRGSEPGKSWHWVRQLSEHCRVSVITQGISINRDAIEAELRERPRPNLRFYFLDGPSWLLHLRPTDLRFHLNYLAWQLAALRLARKILAADRFDLAHHVSYASIVRPIFMQRLPVPLIFGPVGGGEIGHRAFWGGGTRALGYEWLRTTRVRSLRIDPLVRATLAGAALTLLTTPESAQVVPPDLRTRIGIDASSGIESDLTRRDSQGAATGQIYAASRLVHWKGLHLAIQAFASVAPRFPHARFTIMGEGGQHARLTRLARDVGVEDRVRITPMLPRAKVLDLAAASDMLLLPSMHDSGGMAVLEAMALGKPVVCLDAGGPAGFVTPECGFKAPLTTPDEAVAHLAAGLEALLGDEERRRAMGAVARRRVVDQYIWERKAERMMARYFALTATGGHEREGLLTTKLTKSTKAGQEISNAEAS